MDVLRFPLSPKEAEAEGIKSISLLNRSALFPTRLRELRNEKGIPQTEFAKELGVTKSTISLYETGDNVPDIKTLYKMAHFFNVSFDYLLGDSDFRQSKNENVAASQLGLSETSIKVLSRLNTTDRQTINTLLQQFYSMCPEYFELPGGHPELETADMYKALADEKCAYTAIGIFLDEKPTENRVYAIAELEKTGEHEYRGPWLKTEVAPDVLDRVYLDRIDTALKYLRKQMREVEESGNGSKA